MANENVEVNPGAPANDGQSGSGGNPPPPPTNGGDGQQPGQSGTGEKVYSFKENRADWVPPHRIQQYAQKVDALERQLRELNEGTTRRNTELARALGVGGPTEQEKSEAEIEEVLTRMYPVLGKLKDIDPERFDQILEAAASAQDVTQNHWKRHAETMFVDLQSEVAKAAGLEKLTDTQVKRLRVAYREEASLAVRERMRRVEAGEPIDPNDFIGRHERGDKTLLKEFAKQWADDWFEPVRRSTQAAITRRNRPVPSGERSRTPVTSTPLAIDYKDDEAFGKALAAARFNRE